MAKQPLLGDPSSGRLEFDARASMGIRSSNFNLAPQNLACGSMNFERKRPKRVSNYILGPILGEGSYGVVRDAIDTASSRRVAIKCIKPGFRQHSNAKRIEQQLVTEVEYLQRFHHQNLIRAVDIFCSAQGRDYMVLPVATCSMQQLLDAREEELLRAEIGNGSVASGSTEALQYSPQAGSAFLDASSTRSSAVFPMAAGYGTTSGPASYGTTGNGALSPNAHQLKEVPDGASFLKFSKKRLIPAGLAKDIVYQVLQGLAYMHKQNLAHNDVKPENILLFPDGTVKLTDFGSIGPTLIGRGTPMYLSPEATGVDNDEEDEKEGAEREAVCPKRNDVWAVGVLLYQLCTNKFPFAPGPNEFALYNNIVHQQVDFSQVIESDGVLPLLKGLLEKNPKKRLTAERALRSQWLAQGFATTSFYEDRKGSDLATSNVRDDAAQYNVRRIFDISDISAMKQLDVARHRQFAHEVRYILGLHASTASSRREMEELQSVFLQPAEWNHYATQGDPDSDVRTFREDTLKMEALTDYCQSVLDTAESQLKPDPSAKHQNGGKTGAKNSGGGGGKKGGCPCVIS